MVPWTQLRQNRAMACILCRSGRFFAPSGMIGGHIGRKNTLYNRLSAIAAEGAMGEKRKDKKYTYLCSLP